MKAWAYLAYLGFRKSTFKGLVENLTYRRFEHANLEIRASRRPRERNNIADIPHPRQEQKRPLQPQPEARVRNRPIAAQVQVPPVGLRVQLLLAHALFQHIQPLLALA